MSWRPIAIEKIAWYLPLRTVVDNRRSSVISLCSFHNAMLQVALWKNNAQTESACRTVGSVMGWMTVAICPMKRIVPVHRTAARNSVGWCFNYRVLFMGLVIYYCFLILMDKVLEMVDNCIAIDCQWHLLCVFVKKIKWVM